VTPDEATRTVLLGELGERLKRLRLYQPEVVDEMCRSLERHGQLSETVAFREGNGLQLVDGFKRLRAAQRLGWSRLRVHVLALDAACAKAIIGMLHEHRSLTELEEGWIVRSLCREHGLSQGAVSQLMRRHKSWVSRRLLLVEGLEESVQADVRLGLLPARSAIAVAALPRGNQRQAAELVVGRGMTTRQAEAMAQHLGELESDDARRQQMQRWPEPEPARASNRPRPRTDREQLLADVAILMRVGVRLEVRLLDKPVQAEGAKLVRDALTELRPLLGTLMQAIARALSLQDRVDATLAQP